MTTKVDVYRETLRSLEDWQPYLLAHSGLPGRRANIELARAVAEEGNEKHFNAYLAYDPQTAPTNTPEEFLAFCGVMGQSKLLLEGKVEVWLTLRHYAADPRWRVREAVAMALQRYGSADWSGLISGLNEWKDGNFLEQRAVAAALCEPNLLSERDKACQTL